MKYINIFFASASDAAELLEIAKKEIDIINSAMGETIHYKILEWKGSAMASMGVPETEILKQMPVEKSDYFVGVFRFKYGQPTGNKNEKTGKPYGSGMEEEFLKAYEAWKNKQGPKIMIFRSMEAVPREYAFKSDLIKLEKFFKNFEADGKHPGLYNTYKSKEEFAVTFRKNILHCFAEELKAELKKEIPKEYENYKLKKGKWFADIYFEGENEKRNAVKQREIETTNVLKLQSNSGYSFIAKRTIHNSFIRNALARGMKFKIIMQNPWSVNAVYLALDQNSFENPLKYKEYLHHKLDADEIIEAYRNCHWKLERFQFSMNGYRELRREYGRNIELKVSDRDLSNSVLLTDRYLMMEPYFNTAEAVRKDISLFEIQIDSNTDIYKSTNNYFDVLWNSGYTYDYFKKNERLFVERLRDYLRKDRRNL